MKAHQQNRSSYSQVSGGMWISPTLTVGSYSQQTSGFRIQRKSKNFRVARLCLGPQGSQQPTEISYTPRFTSKSAEPKQIQPQIVFTTNSSLSPPPPSPLSSSMIEHAESTPSVFDIVRRGNFPSIIYDVKTSSISIY